MMRLKKISLHCILFTGCLTLAVATSHAITLNYKQTSPVDAWVNALSMVFNQAENQVNQLASITDKIALSLIAGAELYITDDGGNVSTELWQRAGGLNLLQRFAINTPWPVFRQGDIVVISSLGIGSEGFEKLIRQLRNNGSTIIWLGSTQDPLSQSADFIIDTGLPAGLAGLMPTQKYPKGSSFLAPVGNITLGWVFISELVASATRLNEMPVLLESIHLPGGAARNTKYGKQRFHTDINVPPVAAGTLTKVWLSDLRRCLSSIALSETSVIEQAATVASKSISLGNTAWYNTDGHSLPGQLSLPSAPNWLKPLPVKSFESWEGITHPVINKTLPEPLLNHNDSFTFFGYYYLPDGFWQQIQSYPMPQTWVIGGRNGNYLPLGANRIIVDAYWGYGDASVTVPGYDIRIIPPSGVIHSSLLWMLTSAISIKIESE